MANIVGKIGMTLKVDADPSAGAGTPAPVPTVAQFGGNLWIKTAAANTAWTRVGSETTVAATYAANNTIPSDLDIAFINSSGGAFNLTFSNPALQSKQKLLIVDIGGTLNTNPVTLIRFAAESIAGLAASKLLQTNWGTYNVTTNLVDWFL